MNEHRKEPSQSGVLIVGVGASRGLGAAIARRFAVGTFMSVTSLWTAASRGIVCCRESLN
jgi:NAD(P)-dependent dehydrogenase (short-subunit alcohol dehydrogenase family)